MTDLVEKKENCQFVEMRTIVNKLSSYMDKVTDKECNPTTVQAAVNCADKIIDIFRLHMELERLKIKRDGSV